MERIPEPELMDDAEQAEAYAAADFAAVNQSFVDRFVAWLHAPPAAVVDLGCGPADIPIRMCRALPGAHVTAIDGSPAMIELGRMAVTEAGLSDRIELVVQTLPGPTPARTYDALVSNSLLHHLHDPQVMWTEVRALAKPDASLFVMDLFRPASESAAARLVDEHAGDEPDVLRRDFYNSLLAAFSPDEVRAQLAAAGIDGVTVEPISDRHMLISGRFN